MELIDTECIFYPPESGASPLPSADYCYGRNSPDRSMFMPHLVIGDPKQREALVARSKRPPELTEEYLGVAFLDGDSPLVPDRPLRVTMALMYFPGLQYAAVVEAVTFTLRVGPRVVGYGTVLRRYSDAHQTPE